MSDPRPVRASSRKPASRGRARAFRLADYARRLESYYEERETRRREAFEEGSPAPSASERYAHAGELFGPEQLRALRALTDGEGEEAAEARLLLPAAVAGYLGQGLAALSDRIEVAERQAIVIWRGERIAYQALPVRIAATAHRGERNGLDASYREAMEAINPLREEWIARRAELLGEVELDEAGALLAGLHGDELDAFSVEVQRFIHESETVYYAALRRYLARIDIEQGDGSEADAAYILRGSGWDALFPPRRLIAAIAATLDGLGLDPEATEAPRLLALASSEVRPAWFAVRVPGEVTVAFGQVAGVDAYRAALHALGHAWQRSAVDAARSLGARRFGDPALGGGYASLFEDLLLEPEWLVGELGMDEGALASLADFAAFAKLYRLRRDAALHLYQLRRRGGADAALARAYFGGTLSLLTGVNVSEAGYLTSIRDGRHAPAARIRGAWLGSALSASFRREHGTTWWRRPEAGVRLRRAWAQGNAWSPQDLVAHLGYDRLDWRPVLRYIRTQLVGELSGYGGPNITTRAGTRKV